jgi:hypothetical protein
LITSDALTFHYPSNTTHRQKRKVVSVSNELSTTP